MKSYFSFVLFFGLFSVTAPAQQHKRIKANPVYVDKSGVLRWTGNNKEAAFFGVNYTVPFAYGYRSVKALGIDPEKAIDDDVYHMARLGFNAFRVHVWDNEITDSMGNLKENEHLRLFDYLIAKLKERGIKTFLTPLAYWRGGYPEPEPNTGAFSSLYDKRQVLVTEAAIKAQEAYLQQLLKHVNPYTKTTYGEDKDVIAIEINNEPHHSGPKQGAADYIRRMITAVRQTGWTKPVFYNISESPAYADVVAAADIEGVSFQWYPTGLVANRSLKGNMLPHVDLYKIPFGDTIPQYRNKARMVYEFDAGDVPESYLYPAMVRSFRTAGFQWATQFAYDPMATAYGNTEYQTHYLNLAYTPSKAISLLIAGKVFQEVPRLKSFGTYPLDSVFGAFKVSYKNNLSEMNTPEAFYYSNTTTSRPVQAGRLKAVAGVGQSPVVNYSGTGAYFLDKLESGVWRLEVMPDAITIRDPFEKASPQKEVVRIQWQQHSMQLTLPDLGESFNIKGINEGNSFTATARGNRFAIQPGTYLLRSTTKGNKDIDIARQKIGFISLREFVAPQPFATNTYVAHEPLQEVTANKPFHIKAVMVSIDSGATASAEIRNTGGKWKTVPFQKMSAYEYTAEVPADMVTPGIISYRIIVQKRNKEFLVFPGSHAGDPYAWDAYRNETWQTFVANEGAPIELFNAATDRNNISLYNPDWRSNAVTYVAADAPRSLALKAAMSKPVAGSLMGLQLFIGDKFNGRAEEAAGYTTLVIKARASSGTPAAVRLALINKDAVAFAATATLTNDFKEIEIPLSSLRQHPFLLLPRPYPGFLPLYFTAGGSSKWAVNDLDRLELTWGPSATTTATNAPLSIEITSVYLRK